ncbi:MAG: hypothetical protein WAN46_09925 [Gammaproteobacteria bacterium]|jgi:hypothetical protein
MISVDMTTFEEVAIANLLGHRFGDGLIYVRSRDERRLLKRAMRLGFVDEGGYLTAHGKRFWQQRIHLPQGVSRMQGPQRVPVGLS